MGILSLLVLCGALLMCVSSSASSKEYATVVIEETIVVQDDTDTSRRFEGFSDTKISCRFPVEMCSPRHRQEKLRLLGRLQKEAGIWSPGHPRTRLLRSLYDFQSYRRVNKAEVQRWRDLYNMVAKRQKAVLDTTVSYREKLNAIEHLIDKDGVLCDKIVAHALEFYEIDKTELEDFGVEEEKSGRRADRVSVLQALKHYVRDWAAEGISEREAAFPCILSTLSNLYPSGPSQNLTQPNPKVLLPGAGLGRLGFEVADVGGFDVTMNEWSTYMIVAFRYLEAHLERDSFVLHPFIDGLSNHATSDDLKRSVSVPDEYIGSGASSVMLVEGDFTTIFTDETGQYDVIVTHFFIDTARNLMDYLDTIYRLLRPGGHWINFGPLLYGTGPFVQLSLDEVILVSEAMGFEFGTMGEVCGEPTFPGAEGGLGKIRSKHAAYGFNDRELRRNTYLAQAWLAKKAR